MFEINLCHPIHKIATYTWGDFAHAEIRPEKRFSSLLIPFGMVITARLKGVVRCKLVHTCHVSKRQSMNGGACEMHTYNTPADIDQSCPSTKS
jgi:hypothetical protein